MTTLRVDTLLSIDGTVERTIADLPDGTAINQRIDDVESELSDRMGYAVSHAALLAEDRTDFVDGQQFSVEDDGIYVYNLTLDSFSKYTGDAFLSDLSSNGGNVLEFSSSDFTVNVPGDYLTEKSAIDDLGAIATAPGTRITINLQTGYSPETPIVLQEGDYSRFRIVSEDAEVSVSGGFPLGSYYITGRNARLPYFGFVLNASKRAQGIQLFRGSYVFVEANAGVKNSWSNGLSVNEASTASVRNSVFTGAGNLGNTGSGITVWGGQVDAEGADTSNSDYYGAQASHGGVLNFRQGISSSCARYNVRATDGGLLDFDEGTANSAGIYNIYAFNGSYINARSANASNGGQSGAGGNVIASTGSTICAVDGNFDGGQDFSVRSQTGSHIALNNAYAQRLGSSGSTDIVVSSGSTISANGSTGGRNITDNTVTASGIIFK